MPRCEQRCSCHTNTFDPAAWLAAYEEVGGRADVVHMWHSETRDGPVTYNGIWLGITFVRDGDEGKRLVEELNDGNSSSEEGRRRNLALQDYLIETRGVVGTAPPP
jgi:hypothetical protein